MTLRTFKHAVTGRSVQVLKGSRTERLVEADENWSEQKESSDGAGKSGGRGSGARKVADGSGSKPRRSSAPKG